MIRRITALLMYRKATAAEARLVRLVAEFDAATGSRPGFKCPPTRRLTLPQPHPAPLWGLNKAAA